ncbi:MAG: 3-methyl-2-oxobutanoate hydroxymethyltransferase [Gemmatimonadaceae bacterium]|nr:3-methyl-2-oxobutanoate hydroxymethyltransferase [Gemmatimonadaceae bacterium]
MSAHTTPDSTTNPAKQSKPVTIRDLHAKKAKGEKIVATTAYDVLFGRLVDSAGVDMVLVGDSLGMVIAGHESTRRVTLDQMIWHCAAVRRGVRRAMLIFDMPWMTYQVSSVEAVRNAGRAMAETDATAVKLEGAGRAALDAVRACVDAGIPVMGHIGYTPQSDTALSGARVQGREAAVAEQLMQDAIALQDAGAFATVLELMPTDLSRTISAAVTIPTIGIGAGAGCDGQILVLPDLIGLNEGFTPKFLRRYADVAGIVRTAVTEYADDVRAGRYPDETTSFA